MKSDTLIIGLGNPGKKYAKNRHNVGFLFLNWLADQQNIQWKSDKKLSAEISQLLYKGHSYVVLKPQTYMNKSGLSLGAYLRYHQTNEIIIVSDDKDLPFGALRWRQNGRHGGHNGLRDLLRASSDRPLRRLKIGVDTGVREKRGMKTSDFVLSDFSKAEHTQLHDTLFPEAWELLEKNRSLLES